MKIQESQPHTPKLAHAHHWKARLVVCLIMLSLGFIGLILTSIKSLGAFQTWYYWVSMGPIFAALTIWLSWHLRKQNLKQKSVALLQDSLHWLGAVGAIVIMHIFVTAGILGRFEGGFVVLTLLAFACFTSGIYFERSFLFVGIILATMAILVSMLTQYITVILSIVLIASALFLFFKLRHIKP